MPNWDCSPTARPRSFTPVSLLSHYLEAEVGIERFLLCLRGENDLFAEWIKLSLPLLSLSRLLKNLLKVMQSSGGSLARSCDPRDCSHCSRFSPRSV